MYTLSIKAINTKEDLFFEDTKECDVTAQRNFASDVKQSLNLNIITTTKRYKEGNVYVKEYIHTYFKTIKEAEIFVIALIESKAEIRSKIRLWNQQNMILSEINVFDKHNTLVKQLTNCLTQTCVRFGGACDEENGCPSVPFAKEYSNSKKPFPIKVIAS